MFNFREYGLDNYAHPGVGPALMDDDELEEKWTRHNYYQWVVFFLFFQVSKITKKDYTENCIRQT